MKSREKILELLDSRKKELDMLQVHYSVENPDFRTFVWTIASKMKKKASDIQMAFDVKIQMLEIDIRNLELCLGLNEQGVLDLLAKERLEGGLARSKWNSKSKPIYDSASRIIKHTPGFLLGLKDKTGFDGALEFHRDFFNKMSLRIESDLEWVLSDE